MNDYNPFKMVCRKVDLNLVFELVTNPPHTQPSLMESAAFTSELGKYNCGF